MNLKTTKLKSLIITLITSLMVGCANTGANYRPIVDTRGVDLNRYEVDLRECQQYATQTMGAGESAAAGAAAGAAACSVFVSPPPHAPSTTTPATSATPLNRITESSENSLKIVGVRQRASARL